MVLSLGTLLLRPTTPWLVPQVGDPHSPSRVAARGIRHAVRDQAKNDATTVEGRHRPAPGER